jgi:hypothetical protein
MTTTRYCGATVPDSLRGNLRASKCHLALNADGRHIGDHKSTYSIPRVGRVTFRWKTGWKIRRSTQPPPVIALPAPEWGNKPRSLVNENLCECPPWKTGHLHTYPCKLVNR